MLQTLLLSFIILRYKINAVWNENNNALLNEWQMFNKDVSVQLGFGKKWLLDSFSGIELLSIAWGRLDVEQQIYLFLSFSDNSA